MKITKMTFEIKNTTIDQGLFDAMGELNRKLFGIGLDISVIPSFIVLNNGGELLAFGKASAPKNEVQGNK